MPDTLRVSLNKLRGETASAHFFCGWERRELGARGLKIRCPGLGVVRSFRWLLAFAVEPRLVIEILVVVLLLFNGVGDGFPRTPLPINLRPTTSLAGLGSEEKVWGLGKMM